MAAYHGGGFGVLFVTNVLNGTVAAAEDSPGGTVVRRPRPLASPPRGSRRRLVVGSGFDEATNAAALVLGPTGAGLSANGTLYVVDTMRSRVQAIPDALVPDELRTAEEDGFRRPVPEGAARAGVGAERGHPHRQQQRRRDHRDDPAGPAGELVFLDSSGSPKGAGTLFGLALGARRGGWPQRGIYFVDDGENQLNLFH